MWTDETRQRHARAGLRYPSDLTDAEWALIEPHIPPARRGGRRRKVDMREVVQAMLYILETGCQWRHLPKDVSPRSTVWEYFDLWRHDGTLDRIHETLYLALHEAEGREAAPTAAIIDSQTVKSVEKGGLDARKPALMRARRRRASSATRWSTRSA